MFWSVRLSQGRQNQIGQSMGGGGGGGVLGAGIGQIPTITTAAATVSSSSPPISIRTNDFIINNNNIDSDPDLLIDDNSEPIDTISHRFLSPQQPSQPPPRKRSLVQALLNSANLTSTTTSNQDNSGNINSIKMFMDSGSSTILPPAAGIHNFGDPLGIHDPSEAELGGVGHENVGPFVKRSRKILRGLLLMIIIALCWVAVIHLFRISFHRERILYSISAEHFNISKLFSSSSNNRPNSKQIENQNLNETKNLFRLLPPSQPPTPMALTSNKGPKMKQRLSAINEFPRSKFDAPYLVTWYCSVWNIFYMPVYLMIHAYFLSRRSKTNQNEQQQQQQQQSCSNSGGSSAVSNNPFGSNVSNNKSACSGSSSIGTTDTTSSSATSIKKVLLESIQGIVDRGFTLMQFFSRCAFFCALCTLANYMLIFSLRILDATVVMALFATSVSLVYLLSWVVLHQQFVGIRIVGIIIVDTGVAILVYMDGIQNQTLATVMIAFGSAIVFAVYKVFMRRMIGYTTFAQMALFHSLVGVLNMLLAWPLILILYATGVEIIVWSEIPWLFMTGASLCFLIANLIASFGVICTYEFFITLGMFFAIPISAVIDIYINSVIFRDMKLGGVLLILIGFLVVLLPDNWNGYLMNAFRNRLKKWKRREENKKNGRVQDTTTGQLSRLRTSSGRVK
ncbi:uncharacterized protein LOC124494619 isoform X2 [Dermatophagoides farinae]|uniref:uncharacterized protein LOC124494619 isoform X2 n=1 Tax=Dermatophagoides farinae TaxID=6954 RepID=UPI001F10D983|nr:uncharacterized protein LOC124494619 isoform X2 [Dermatophagoides farinae]